MNHSHSPPATVDGWTVMLPTMLGFFLGFWLGLSPASAQSKAPPEKATPNIVFIIADDQG